MKVLFTGAHFTPAIAVIEELKKYPDVNIVYVGRRSTQEGDSSPSQESQIVPRLGVKFIPIIAGRLQREFTIYTIPSLLKIPIGIIQAFFITLKEKPDVILSFGGYVAVPTVIVGWLFSVPIIVHEQTLVSGLANKITSLFADKIALSFRGGNEADNKNTFVSGNPIRSIVTHPDGNLGGYYKIFNVARGEKLPVILIGGGNQGSHIINETIETCVEKLTKIACIIHVTGDNKFSDFERLRDLGEYGERYLVKKWIGEEYGAILQKVDLVVSRAGANTLTELAYMGKPALVIPIPYLYQDEQNKNAKYFGKLGLVKILPQSRLSGKSLVENIKLMLNDPSFVRGGLNHFKKKAKKVKKFIIPDASKRLALETILLGKTV